MSRELAYLPEVSREYYEKLSKVELVRKLMLGKMQRSEYTNGRNAEIKAWVEEHPDIKEKASQWKQIQKSIVIAELTLPNTCKIERLDPTRHEPTLRPMPVARDKVSFAQLLRKNPQRSAPALPKTSLTVAKLHRYKERLRAYDAARVELNLASPAQIQRENSAVGTAFHPRIVRFSQHV